MKPIKPVGTETKNIHEESTKTQEQQLAENIEMCAKLAIDSEKTKILTNPSLNKSQLHVLMDCEVKHNHTLDQLQLMSEQEHWMVISTLSEFFNKGKSIDVAKEIIGRNLHPVQTTIFLGLSDTELKEETENILMEVTQSTINSKENK